MLSYAMTKTGKEEHIMEKPTKIKRVIACFLIMMMAFLTPSVHIQAAGKTTTYVKEFKLYVVKNDKTVGSFDENGLSQTDIT